MRFALSEDQRLLQDSVQRALASLAPLERVRRFADQEIFVGNTPNLTRG